MFSLPSCYHNVSSIWPNLWDSISLPPLPCSRQPRRSKANLSLGDICFNYVCNSCVCIYMLCKYCYICIILYKYWPFFRWIRVYISLPKNTYWPSFVLLYAFYKQKYWPKVNMKTNIDTEFSKHLKILHITLQFLCNRKS